jgi:hypothetical protein
MGHPMTRSIPFHSLFHADWSMAAKGRWLATAVRSSRGWQITAPRPLGCVKSFVDGLFIAPGPVFAGFDFPIGLPTVYGQGTGLANFPSALAAFGRGEWSEFFHVAERPEQISRARPFYPRVSAPGTKKADLLRGLGVDSVDALLRRCDHRTPTRQAACSIFWTLGANQVGKAAISGWQDVIKPARQRGARLWPFDGNLAELAVAGVPVLAETYPAEAYGHVGIEFTSGKSKQRQEDRRAAMDGLCDWANRHDIDFTPDLVTEIENGFGPSKNGDDALDALAGLLGMIEVADGRRPERPATIDKPDVWEGWILGQAA